MIRRLREMYRRSRLDREPDEVIVKNVVLKDFEHHCIWDTMEPGDWYEDQPWWWRLKTRIRYFPMDTMIGFENASEDVAEYERGRWDEKPSHWTYLKSAFYRHAIIPLQDWRRARRRKRGPLSRLRQRWRLFWGLEKLVVHRVRFVNKEES